MRKSGKEEVERGRGRIAVDRKRWCFNFRPGLSGHLCKEDGGADSVRDAGECGSDREATECVLVRVLDPTSPPDLVVGSVSVSFPISQCSLLCVANTFFM